MNILWLDSVDSTNTEAFRRLPELASGTVLAAREQTAGRGQRGNSWFTEPGTNLTFSIVLKFGRDALGDLPLSCAHWLNYLTSDVVAGFLEENGVHAVVKWPNDVYVNRRKICGILIENSLKGVNVDASVIGVGINVNQQAFPQLANATSLSCCTGKTYDLPAALEQVMAIFTRQLPALFDEKRRQELFEAYSSRLFQHGVKARYRDLLLDEEFTGVIESVAPDGRLCVFDGTRRRYFRFKEVSYIL